MIGDTRVGRVLAGLRDQRGVTQADLARKVGIHPSTLSKYENLGRIPEEVFLRICEALSYDPDTVVEAALQLFRQDLRQAQLARSASTAGEEPPERKRIPRDQRPSLAQLGELYDSYAAEKRKLLLATLQYLGSYARPVSGILPDIELPKRRKTMRRAGGPVSKRQS